MKDDIGSSSSVARSEKIKIKDDILLPEFYWQNRITLLSVNDKRQFFYWEITENFLKKKLSRVDDNFKVRVILDSLEVDSLEISSRNGSFYTSYEKPFGGLRLKLTSLDNILLLESNEIILPSKKVHIPKNEIWMTKKLGVVTTKSYSGLLFANAENIGASENTLSKPSLKKLGNLFTNANLDLLSSNALSSNTLSSNALSSNTLSSNTLSANNSKKGKK